MSLAAMQAFSLLFLALLIWNSERNLMSLAAMQAFSLLFLALLI